MDILVLADFIGWIGNVCFIIGCIEMARKHPIKCMWWNVFGNSIWTIMGILMATSAIICLSLLLAIINGVAIYRWSKDNGNTK